MAEVDTQALLKQILACPGGVPSIIVIDTLAQSMMGGNENSGEDMGKVLGHCLRIHNATDALVLLIHHSGKDAAKGARGWSGLRAASDAEIEVLRDGKEHVATLTKLKGGEDGIEFPFHLTSVVIGQDEDQDDITSCIVSADDSLPIARTIHPRGLVQRIVASTLQALYEMDGEWPTTNALLANAVADLPPDDQPHHRRTAAVARALRTLCDAQQLVISPEGIVSTPE